VDLSFRAKQEGYASYYLSDVTAMHIGRVSSGQASSKTLYYSLLSRLKYAMKYFGRMETIVLILLVFTFEFIARVFQALFSSSALNIGGVFSAYKRLVKSFISGRLICH
jgi:GT2 family glycosyltransferase